MCNFGCTRKEKKTNKKERKRGQRSASVVQQLPEIEFREQDTSREYI
jgi:hypothetical protein